MRFVSCFFTVLTLLRLLGCQTASHADLRMEIVTLDVGQGSSTLIRTSDGDILVDAGTDLSEESLCRRLRALGVERLELLILTHPDDDHIGGADGIVEQFDVGAVWTNGASSESECYERLTDALGKKEIYQTVVQAGDGCDLGNLQLSVLAPLSEKTENDNANSMILLWRCGDFGGLIMGDATERIESILIAEYGNAQLDVDVLWVGHHGSNDASSEAFLEAVHPRYAVISCGAGNVYGHPDGRTLTRLKAADAEILRTDLLGEIRMEIYESEIRLATVQTSEDRGE